MRTIIQRFWVFHRKYRLSFIIKIRISMITVLALGTLFFFTAPATAESGSTGQTNCVGLVVDSGQGEPVTACIPYKSGMTGQDVLLKAGESLNFDSHRLLCQINSYPKTCTSDNT